MDKEQLIQISLAEYLEMKETLDHRKEVKITETWEYKQGRGISVEWKSDGACWSYLASKLSDAGERVKELINEIEKHKKMSIFEFIKYRRKG